MVILRDVEESIIKFRARLQDLASFFTRENAANFDAFFTSELNNIYYRVELTTIRGELRLTFRRGSSVYEIPRGSWANKLDFDWPAAPA